MRRDRREVFCDVRVLASEYVGFCGFCAEIVGHILCVHELRASQLLLPALAPSPSVACSAELLVEHASLPGVLVLGHLWVLLLLLYLLYELNDEVEVFMLTIQLVPPADLLDSFGGLLRVSREVLAHAIVASGVLTPVCAILRAIVPRCDILLLIELLGKHLDRLYGTQR